MLLMRKLLFICILFSILSCDGERSVRGSWHKTSFGTKDTIVFSLDNRYEWRRDERLINGRYNSVHTTYRMKNHKSYYIFYIAEGMQTEQEYEQTVLHRSFSEFCLVGILGDYEEVPSICYQRVYFSLLGVD